MNKYSVYSWRKFSVTIGRLASLKFSAYPAYKSVCVSTRRVASVGSSFTKQQLQWRGGCGGGCELTDCSVIGLCLFTVEVQLVATFAEDGGPRLQDGFWVVVHRGTSCQPPENNSWWALTSPHVTGPLFPPAISFFMLFIRFLQNHFCEQYIMLTDTRLFCSCCRKISPDQEIVWLWSLVQMAGRRICSDAVHYAVCDEGQILAYDIFSSILLRWSNQPCSYVR